MNYATAMTRLAHGQYVTRMKWQRFNAPHLKLCGERQQVCRVFAALDYLKPVPFVAELEDLQATDWVGVRISVVKGAEPTPVAR